MNNLKVFSLIFVFLFYSCSADLLTKEEKSTVCNNSSEVIPMEKQTNDSFFVSEILLNNYLRLFVKNKKADTIKPITKRGETVAYYVHFEDNKGWFLISADQRLSPILVSSEEGFLPDSYEDIPSLCSVSSILQSVLDVRKSNSNEVNSIWYVLSPNIPLTKSVPLEKQNIIATKAKYGLRGMGEGMWIPQDTTIRVVNTTLPRVTSTKWGQSDPWNQFTPIRNNHNSYVGCGPVAAGQIIYKYVSSNPGTHEIPTAAIVPPNGDDVIFSNFSTTGWAYLVEELPHIMNDCEPTAIFLSWIGQNMQAQYGYPQGTGTIMNKLKSVLNNYVNYRNGFTVSSNNDASKRNFCDTLISSIQAGSPVLLEPDVGTHFFLIDYYGATEYQLVVRYEFDPYHQITENDLFYYPDWCFEWPVNINSGETPETEDILPLMKDEYVKINWGHNGTSNNISYILRSKSYSYFDGNPLSNEYINLTWIYYESNDSSSTYSNIYNWCHHFSRKNN